MPVSGDDQVLIQVEAAGLSFVDTLMVRNLHQNKHSLPFAPGMEIAGHIVTAPLNTRFKPGDRVAALVYDGGLAEFARANLAETFLLPESLPATTAAACLSTYLTAGIALFDRAELRKGEAVLVLGAAGGTGLAAVDIAHNIGAVVIAAASSSEKLDVAKQAGADIRINYSEQNLKAGLKPHYPQGVNVVFDPVAGDLYADAFASLGWGGRYLIIGFAGGEIPQFAANRLLVKHRSALGFALMYYRRFAVDKLQRWGNHLLEEMSRNNLKPLVSRTGTLEQAPAMLQSILERKVMGKMVVTF